MKKGDIVKHRPFGIKLRIGEEEGLLLTWWEYPGDEERNEEIYWKVLINGTVRNIKERHLEVVNEAR